MKVWGSANVLTEKELNQIEKISIEIISKVGFKVENVKILKFLKSAGARVRNDNIVLFSKKWIRDFLNESRRIDTDFSGKIEIWAGGYPSYFLPPGKNTPLKHNLRTCEIMVKVADNLENIDIINSAIGIPCDVPENTMEFYQRLLVWKYFKKPESMVSKYKQSHCGVSLISNFNICPYAIEMATIMADTSSGNTKDFCYGDVYLLSPLVFDRIQGEIFWYLFEKGLHCDVGTVMTLGGTAPVTFSAALPLQLAEIIFVNILQRIFFDINTLHFSNILAPIDMQTGLFKYGRPELSTGILAIGQMARKYGGLFNCGSFYCDAKLPSSEAGMQKAASSVSSVLAGAYGFGVAGLLHTDKVASPEQLIIDSEFAGVLKSFSRNIVMIKDSFDEDHEIEMIKRVGIGGNYLSEVHTVKNLHRLWKPVLSQFEFPNTCIKKENNVDVAYAKAIYDNIIKRDEKTYISSETENELYKVIKKAEKKLI